MAIVSLSSVSYSEKLHRSNFFFSNSSNKSSMSFPGGVMVKTLETRWKSKNFVTQFQAKQVACTGVGSLTLNEDCMVTEDLLSANLLIPPDKNVYSGKLLAELCCDSLKDFNPMVHVFVEKVHLLSDHSKRDTGTVAEQVILLENIGTSILVSENQLGPKAEDISKPVNPFVFLGRLILGALATTYYMLVSIYMWIEDQIIPKGQSI